MRRGACGGIAAWDTASHSGLENEVFGRSAVNQVGLCDWFAAAIAELPEPMHRELLTWFTVMTEGSKTPPRSKSPSETTVRLYTRWFMPALRQRSAEGHVSLREISTEATRAVLPESGNPRSTIGQGLRCVFRALKAHRIIFINPLKDIATGPTNAVSRYRCRRPSFAMDSTRRIRQRRRCRVGRLSRPALGRLTRHPTDHHRVRATPPARAGYPTHSTGPGTHPRLVGRTRPTVARHGQPLSVHQQTNSHTHRTRWGGMDHAATRATAQAIREDRILDELHATGGDVQRICDLFGLSITGANRYVSTLERSDFTIWT